MAELGDESRLFARVPLAVYKRKDLTLLDKLLVGRIASFGDGNCRMSQSKLADELNVHRQHINQRLKILAAKGIIEVTRSRYGKLLYRVAPDAWYSGHLESGKPKQSQSSDC